LGTQFAASAQRRNLRPVQWTNFQLPKPKVAEVQSRKTPAICIHCDAFVRLPPQKTTLGEVLSRGVCSSRQNATHSAGVAFHAVSAALKLHHTRVLACALAVNVAEVRLRFALAVDDHWHLILREGLGAIWTAHNLGSRAEELVALLLRRRARACRRAGAAFGCHRGNGCSITATEANLSSLGRAVYVLRAK
jgi:hypothetical protein